MSLSLSEQVCDELRTMRDEEYKLFNDAIARPVLPSLGVRTPKIKSLAKLYLKTDFDYVSYFESFSPMYYDEQLFAAFLLAGVKADFWKKLEWLRVMIPTFDNWAVVDSFVSSFRDINKHRDEMMSFLQDYVSGGEFEQRFIAVVLMDYYIDDEYINSAVDMLSGLTNPAYYTRMGVAWAVSVIAVKDINAALSLLDGRLDMWTHNKAIQKICESRRIDTNCKNKFKLLKRR